MSKDEWDEFNEQMALLWEDMKGGLHSELTSKDVWEYGFETGYRAGIDRGMEIQREADEQLRKEGLDW